MTDFVTVEAIPMLETGIEYPASTGPFTVTSSMLQECVEAQDDPHLLAPRLKIGHAANPIDADLQALWEEVNDGRDESQPSLGTILNMKVINAGQTLIGDFHGLPQWLADIMMTAYPARSIEGGYWKNPANGKEYSFMLEALALLGVVGPGCTSLDDLQELFSDEGPKVTVIEMGSRPEVTASNEGGHMPVVAQVNVEDIRRAFYEDFAQGDRYWWWDRELLIDPNEMIIEDPDAGQLYRLPVDLGEGEDAEVSFGDPEPVKVRYVPDGSAKSDDEDEDADVAASRRLIAPQLEKAGKVLAVNTTPPRESERKKEAHMDKVRERLGLPSDATEDDILKAMDEQEGEQPSGESEPGESDGDPADQGGETGTASPEAEGEPEGEPAPTGEPVAANGTVPVDPETFAQLRRDAEAGRQARDEQVKAERKRLLDDAIKAGKFPPARREHYATLLKKDPDGTKHLLTASVEQGGLAPGVVPVGEVGAAGGDSDLQTDAYDPSLLSRAERKRIEAAREGEPPRVARDQQEVRVSA